MTNLSLSFIDNAFYRFMVTLMYINQAWLMPHFFFRRSDLLCLKGDKLVDFRDKWSQRRKMNWEDIRGVQVFVICVGCDETPPLSDCYDCRKAIIKTADWFVETETRQVWQQCSLILNTNQSKLTPKRWKCCRSHF